MKARILVCDDDAHLRESLRDNLELEGYDVVEAPTGQDALRQVVTGFFDVILMDFNLTDATGIDVIRQIRTTNSESQIVMMTAHASLDTAVKAIQESVYDFLIKPVDFSYLKRTISKCLEKLRLQQENQRLINELKKANAALLNLSNMKSKFMSMASHDLANSIMTMQLSFDLLTSGIRPDEEQQKRIVSIGNGMGQLVRLTDDLVDWAAIEQGRFRLEKREFALGKLIEEAVLGPQNRAKQRGIELKADVSPTLPPVVADRKRVLQVLNNLMENAIRHTPKGGSVTLSGEAVADAVQISVRDTGDGIAGQELNRIFESFYQPSNGADGKHGRLGLGLSIAREIVTAHGGKIWVESPGLGKGATFFFTLPTGFPAGSKGPRS